MARCSLDTSRRDPEPLAGGWGATRRPHRSTGPSAPDPGKGRSRRERLRAERLLLERLPGCVIFLERFSRGGRHPQPRVPRPRAHGWDPFGMRRWRSGAGWAPRLARPDRSEVGSLPYREWRLNRLLCRDFRYVPEGLGTVAGGTTTGTQCCLEEHPGGARWILAYGLDRSRYVPLASAPLRGANQLSGQRSGGATTGYRTMSLRDEGNFNSPIKSNPDRVSSSSCSSAIRLSHVPFGSNRH